MFFGETETSVEICTVGEFSTVSAHKYHYYNNSITTVTGDRGKLVLKACEQAEIKEKIESLIPEDYEAEVKTIDSFDEAKITRLITFKQSSVGGASIVKPFVEADGVFYRENGEKLESVTRTLFVDSAYDVVKGA